MLLWHLKPDFLTYNRSNPIRHASLIGFFHANECIRAQNFHCTLPDVLQLLKTHTPPHKNSENSGLHRCYHNATPLRDILTKSAFFWVATE